MTMSVPARLVNEAWNLDMIFCAKTVGNPGTTHISYNFLFSPNSTTGSGSYSDNVTGLIDENQDSSINNTVPTIFDIRARTTSSSNNTLTITAMNMYQIF